MRRFLTLVCLLCLAIPAGISISGCTRDPGANYCNGEGYGTKITDVFAISLSPTSGSLSMAFGQTKQVSSPSATTCKGSSASVSSFTYGTSNNQLLDISPAGSMCAGTWNRNTGGGIADYTVCSPPASLPSTNGLPYASVTVTATAVGVSSNPVLVYVHAPVTSLNLVGPTACLSQNTTYPTPLDVQAYYNNNGTSTLLCAPNASPLPTCANSIGTLSYSVANSSIASLNSANNQITAQMPGTTLITASIAGTASSAGYFSTCPPESISVTLADGTKSGSITQGVTQNLVTTVTDTQGKQITGLSLDYQSTEVEDITASSTGSITTTYPGATSIYAVCQPPSCNPAPLNLIGEFGTGMAISSNAVAITTPGTASQYVWYAAPGQSQYLVPVEMLTGSVGSSVRLPYVPNSMKMDRNGNSLYFGSAHELMIYSALSNSLSKEDTSAPGVVLAVSPDNSTLLINDQAKQLFYLYSSGSGISSTYGGMGATAAFTPDTKTLYIADSADLNYTPDNIAAGYTNHKDMLYVYNYSTGWSSYPLPSASATVATCQASSSVSCSRSLALTVPGVGAYLSGAATVSHTWCPSGTVGNTAGMSMYPQADTISAATDVLAATNDGAHILGATLSASGVTTLSDISVTVPTTACVTGTATIPAVGASLTAMSTNGVVKASLPFGSIAATNLNQILVSPNSALAFLTYTGTTAGAPLPYYTPATGKLSYLALHDATTPTITAPVAGAFSPDNTLFFVSTSGDNKVHYIDLTKATPADSQQISPNLPSCIPVSQGGHDAGCTYTGTGAGTTVVPATVITVRPRATT